MTTPLTRRLLALFATLALGASACIDAEPVPLAPNDPDVELATHVGDWRNEIIYQLLVDRFDDGDPNNNFNVDRRAPGRYHGGDWQGVIDRLDYLEALGVTTLWISPVVRNVEEDAGFASYHGYWAQDFLKHNPHFGSLEDLRRLSDALHARGMKLIVDIVTNHVGQAFFYDINQNGRPDEWLSGSGDAMPNGPIGDDRALSRITEYDPDWDPSGIKSFTSLGLAGPAPIVFFYMPEINRVPPGPGNLDLNGDGVISGRDEQLGFANPDWYHQKGRVIDWNDPGTPPYQHWIGGDFVDGQPEVYYQNDQTLFGDFPGGLKDLATEKEAVRRAMSLVYGYWIDASDCDGFRIDTLKHVEYSFWRDFAPAIREHALKRGKRNFFMFGEAFDGNDQLLGAYTGPDQVDSVFYFSQKYAIDSVFKCPPGNEAPFCAGRTNGTADMVGWGGTDRLDNFSATPQPGGPTDDSGAGLAPRQLLVNFLDNHDVARYLYDRFDARGVDSLRNALFFLLTTQGIPCLYYGTEQAFFGGNDPANREDMSEPASSWFANYNVEGYRYHPWNTDSPMFRHVQKLIELRKVYVALRLGDFAWRWSSSRAADERDAGILAFERRYHAGQADEEIALVVINTHETQASTSQAPDADGGDKMPTAFPAGTVLVDHFGDDRATFTVEVGGVVAVTVPPMSGRVLVGQ